MFHGWSADGLFRENWQQPPTDPPSCVEPGKRDECVYEVRLPPEDSASGGEEESEGGEIGMIKGVGTMVKIFHFIMKQSYICALIAMMVSRAAQSFHLSR